MQIVDKKPLEESLLEPGLLDTTDEGLSSAADPGLELSASAQALLTDRLAPASLSLLAIAALAACGGGGGDTAVAAAPAAAPGMAPAPPAVAPPATTPPATTPPASVPPAAAPPAPAASSPAPPAAPAPPAPASAPGGALSAATDEQAARFLQQAQFSSTPSEISSVRGGTYADWLQRQYNLPIGQTGWDWLE